MQHIRLLQCTISKAHKWNAFFCPNFQWVCYSSTRTN